MQLCDIMISRCRSSDVPRFPTRAATGLSFASRIPNGDRSNRHWLASIRSRLDGRASPSGSETWSWLMPVPCSRSRSRAQRSSRWPEARRAGSGGGSPGPSAAPLLAAASDEHESKGGHFPASGQPSTKAGELQARPRRSLGTARSTHVQNSRVTSTAVSVADECHHHSSPASICTWGVTLPTGDPVPLPTPLGHVRGVLTAGNSGDRRCGRPSLGSKFGAMTGSRKGRGRVLPH